MIQFSLNVRPVLAYRVDSLMLVMECPMSNSSIDVKPKIKSTKQNPHMVDTYERQHVRSSVFKYKHAPNQ
jgi:hypothetical protein